MTSEEKKKLYAALSAPFPEHCIQRTEGRLTGRGYDTTGIGYQYIANRLNEVLGVGGWRAHRTVNVKEITRSTLIPIISAASRSKDVARIALPVRVRDTSHVSTAIRPIDAAIVKIWTFEMKKFLPML